MADVEYVEGEGCNEIDQTGLWRLDGDTWNQVDPNVASGRPLEGRLGEANTGWLTVRDGQGTIDPPDPDVAYESELGAVESRVWSTPTRTEVAARRRRTTSCARTSPSTSRRAPTTPTS